jgi:hypothetical protein
MVFIVKYLNNYYLKKLFIFKLIIVWSYNNIFNFWTGGQFHIKILIGIFIIGGELYIYKIL